MVQGVEDFEKRIGELPAVLTYFSVPSCNVCRVLKPRTEKLISENFPFMEFLYVDSEQNPEIAALNGVFTSPVILVFFNGKEYIRKSRVIDLEQLKGEILRLYNLMFS